MEKVRALVRALTRRKEGSAAVEFALVGPLFVLLLIGAVVYGGWLWTAQTVQHTASEAARAAVGGLDATERAALARTAAVETAAGGGLRPEAMSVDVRDEQGVVTVAVVYAAEGHGLMALAGVLPAPPPRSIRRTAMVRVGGG